MDAQLLQVSESRKAFYQMLSGFYFRELSVEEIQTMSKQKLVEACESDARLLPGAKMITHYLRTTLRDIRQELAADYAHCILAAGAYEERRATPYESVFTSDEGLLMQDARDDVYRYYCEAGLGVNQGLDIPEDHLSFEFDFMVAMCSRFEEALSEENREKAKEILETQAAFHKEHLINWIDDYCDTLDKVAGTEFYRGVSSWTRNWVHEDDELLSEMLAAFE